MQVPILVEPIASGRFRASLGDPFHVAAEGNDARGAVEEVVRQVEQRLLGGTKIAALTLTDETAMTLPVLPADDAYKSDWVYQELQNAIAEQRRTEDSIGP